VQRSGTDRAAGCCYSYEEAKAEKGEDATARNRAEGSKQAKAVSRNQAA